MTRMLPNFRQREPDREKRPRQRKSKKKRDGFSLSWPLFFCSSLAFSQLFRLVRFQRQSAEKDKRRQCNTNRKRSREARKMKQTREAQWKRPAEQRDLYFLLFLFSRFGLEWETKEDNPVAVCHNPGGPWRNDAISSCLTATAFSCRSPLCLTMLFYSFITLLLTCFWFFFLFFVLFLSLSLLLLSLSFYFAVSLFLFHFGFSPSLVPLLLLHLDVSSAPLPICSFLFLLARSRCLADGTRSWRSLLSWP